MPEEHIPPSSGSPISGPARVENIAPGAPPRPDQAITAHPPPAGSAHSAAAMVRSDVESSLRWVGGMFLILAAGWGFIAVVGYLSVRLGLLPFIPAAVIAALFSFGFFYLLETDLWLSRFLGLRLGPASNQLTEAAFFWVLNFVGLLMRSTEAEKPAADRKSAQPDGSREVVETIVFVVVLVLLLKTFVAEAFVIPTGSMATTLLGYHKPVKCSQCGYEFLVNFSYEADPDGGPKNQRIVVGGRCPNCRFFNPIREGIVAGDGRRNGGDQNPP